MKHIIIIILSLIVNLGAIIVAIFFNPVSVLGFSVLIGLLFVTWIYWINKEKEIRQFFINHRWRNSQHPPY